MNLTDFRHLFLNACIQDVFGNPETLNLTFKLGNGNGAAISIKCTRGFLDVSYSFDEFQTHNRKLILLEDDIQPSVNNTEYDGDTVS